MTTPLTYWSERLIAVSENGMRDIASVEGESATVMMREKIATDIGLVVLGALSDGLTITINTK